MGHGSALPRSDLLAAAARCWIALAAAFYLFDLFRSTARGLTDGAGRPLGWDFINTWSGAFLAWRGDAREVYDWHAFHAFQETLVGAPLDFFHYSYPPALFLLTLPLAFIPYGPALAVWTVGSWTAFYAALRPALPHGGLLLALATPAVFVNALGGQNGTWSAALLGGGLCLLRSRPILAGVLFGLFVYKPHLALLVPIALIAGREWRALAAAGVTATALVLASLALFGAEVWADYFRNVGLLREAVLEDGTGVWHRMLSVFVFARRLGLEPAAAYALQIAVAVLVAGAVAHAWLQNAPANLRYALLVLGSFLATPYLHDYDLVVGAFVAVWLSAAANERERTPALVASVLVLLVPIAGMALAGATGYAVGPLFIAPAAIIAWRMSRGRVGEARPQTA